MSETRPYQREAIASIHERLAVDTSTVVVMATGTGKTRTAMEYIRERLSFQYDIHQCTRVLWLAHRDELLSQAEARARAMGIDSVGREQQARRSTGDERLVCGSVQTLTAQRLASIDRRAFSLIIVDEAHHVTSTSYRRILEHFHHAQVLGLTATPDRLDGKPLADVFNSVAYEYPIDRAIREGYLARVRSRRVVVEGLALGDVRRSRGDLNRQDLAKVLGAEQYLHAVVAPLLELAGDRPTVVFAVDVAHGQALTDMINRYRPVAAALVHGKTSDRNRLYVEHRHRISQFLVNCEVLTEGWDAPYVTCVAIARPTTSRALYTQMVGRGTRLHGDADCLVLDFTGAAGRHSLVGPADVLAGRDIGPELRAAAAKIQEDDPALDSLDVLALAEEWLAEEKRRTALQARVTAVARFYAEEIDPFLGHVRPGMRQLGFNLDEPATADQIKQLKDWGVKAPPEISRLDAIAILDRLRERHRTGRANYKTIRQLSARGYKDVVNWSRKQASDEWQKILRQRYKWSPR